MKVLPESRLGKCSVGLTMFFLLLITTFFAFMLLGLVTFDEGHWWDLTVGVAVLVEIIAFILSIMAVRKTNERSILIYLSIIIGICVILFLFLHSLFINDWFKYTIFINDSSIANIRYMDNRILLRTFKNIKYVVLFILSCLVKENWRTNGNIKRQNNRIWE